MARHQIASTAVIGAAVATLVTLHRLGATYGTTRPERHRPLPGDDLVRCPQTVATHARTIAATPQEIWPWLAQVGFHRGGWYTPRWVDVLFFPDNYPSASQVRDELQDVAVGSFIPDGPPHTECGFVVRDLVENQHLVLQSTTHLPLGWRRRGRRVNWTWTFVLTPEADGRTRLVFRWRARTRPWWVTVGVHVFILPADFVMSRGMLRGLAQRVERSGS